MEDGGRDRMRERRAPTTFALATHRAENAKGAPPGPTRYARTHRWLGTNTLPRPPPKGDPRRAIAGVAIRERQLVRLPGDGVGDLRAAAPRARRSG